MSQVHRRLNKNYRHNHDHPDHKLNPRQSIHSQVKAKAAIRPAKDKVTPESKVVMALAGKQALEAFIDYIESDSLNRKKWLQRVREAGFDQALSEYREMTSPKGMPLQM